MKVLITGGAGFIGSHIAKKLIEEENDVLIVDNLSNGSVENIPEGAEFMKINVSNLTADEIKGYDAVLHYAALKDVPESLKFPKKYFEQNMMATHNLLQISKEAKIPRFIFASTSAVYGHAHRFPTHEKEFMRCMSPYAVSKLASEQMCYCVKKEVEMQTICLRLFNAYGPKMTGNAISIFADNILNDKKSTIYGGHQRRDFIHVDDIVNVNIAALNSTAHGVFNVGSGLSISIKELYVLLCDLTERYEQKVNVDYKEPRLEPFETRASITRAYRAWKWKPLMKLKTGLKQYIDSVVKE